MITLKLKYDCSEDDRKIIEQWRHSASVVTRCAFNLFKRKKELKEVRKILKNYSFTISDSWIINSAISKAEGLWKSNEALGAESVIFGGKDNFKKRAEGKISKEEFRHKRLMPLFIVGQNAGKGNRKSELHLDDNQLLLKLDKNTHIPLTIKINSKTQRKHLETLAKKSQECKASYTLTITDTHVCVAFEEIPNEQPKAYRKERVMAIDMNPNGIGVAVLEDGKYIHTEHVDMSKVVKEGTSNKLDFETFEVAKRLTTLAKHYLCGTFVVEDLSLRSKNHNKGKKLNKLINNNWKRQKLANNISKRCKLCGIKYLPVQAAFSSIVGNNLFQQQPDPICAAMEIARRGVEILKTKRYSLPPVVLNDKVSTRWKDDGLLKVPDSWKELNEWMKNAKLWYRISPDSFMSRVCRSKSLKSMVCVKTYDFR